MNDFRRMAILVSLCCAALVAEVPAARAQTTAFPNRPVTLVSPFAAGGTSDTVARAIARELEAELGQPVIVVNKPGAGGTLGMASVASAVPDGYTLVLGGLGSVVFPTVVYKGRIKYDPARDLAPIGWLGTAPTLIAVRASHPARSLAELVAMARRQPDSLSFASAGVGGTLHVAGVLLEREAGIKLNHVPYRGGAPAMTDVAGGNADLALADLTLAMPYVQSGKIRVLAIASASRSTQLPGVPTTAEAGLPGVRMDTWYAVFAPSGLPATVGERLQSALQLARARAGFSSVVSAQGINVSSATAEEFRAKLKSDFEVWPGLLNQICAQSNCD